MLHFDSSRPKDNQERILPFINIVLLLLIYVLLAGKIALIDPLKTSPPESASEGSVQSHTVVLHLGQNGRLALDGTIMTQPELEDALARMGTLTVVHLKADSRASAKQVVEVTGLLGAAGVDTIDLITLPD